MSSRPHTERTQQQNPKGNKHAPYGYTKHCINPHNFLPTVISGSKTTLTYPLSRGLLFVSTLQLAVLHKPPSQKVWSRWTHRAVRAVPSVLLLREQPLLVWTTLAARMSLSCLGGDSCNFSLSLQLLNWTCLPLLPYSHQRAICLHKVLQPMNSVQCPI